MRVLKENPMNNRQKTLAALVAASFAVIALPSYAEDIYISIDPPNRRVEKYEHRAGYVWAPGYWDWKNGKHEWVAGRQVAERNGYRWQNDRWVRHDNDKWTMQRGGWSRDSDGDGTPDRNDNYPNNPRKK
jgi:hypothetical protein